MFLDDFHVLPVGDFREHEASRECWCKPVPSEDHPSIWLHNALDQREKFESGERLYA